MDFTTEAREIITVIAVALAFILVLAIAMTVLTPRGTKW